MHAGVCSPRIESDRPRLFIGTEQPDNFSLIGGLALTNMGLGEKAAAFAFVEKAMAAFPIEKDAMLGPTPIEMLARVAAQTGERDRAVVALQKVLSIPYEGPLAAPARSDVRSAPE
jgi:hypothetical protein